MRCFYLKRLKDVSGSSCTGRVAEGVLFQDGTAVLNWFAGVADAISTGIYPAGIAGVERIHGHGGNTVIEFIDDGADAAFTMPSTTPTTPTPKMALPAPA